MEIGTKYIENYNNIFYEQKEETSQINKKSNNKSEKEDIEIQAEVMRLKMIEEKVKAHEMAHMSAGAGLTGSPSFEYQTGPDGKQYIVGGEVPITIKEGKNPEETIILMERVRAAALAPAEPSSADRAIAAKAAAIAMKAQQELANKAKENNGNTESIGNNISIYV